MGFVEYRLNGPYDPEVAVGGGQPAGYDQYVLIYNQQRTIRANVHVRFSDPGAANYLCGYRVRRSSATSSSGLTYAQFMGLPWTQIAPLSTAGLKTREFTFSVVPSDIFGMTQEQLIDDPNFASAVSTTPTNQVYLEVCALNAYGVAISATVEVRVEYEIIFSQPKTLVDA